MAGLENDTKMARTINGTAFSSVKENITWYHITIVYRFQITCNLNRI